MALGTEAPSTGSQREPSRLEQNTNQRLTGHNHSPHQRASRTPAQITRTRSMFYFPQSRMDECFDFSCHPGEVGPGWDWQAENEGTFTWVCVCVCVYLCVCVCVCTTCAFSELQQIQWEWMMGKGLQTWSKMKARVGLECDRHACKCIKISEQSAKY